MKKLVVLAAFLLSTVTTHQAVACDMGAIDTWVASACQGNSCATKLTTQQSAEGCDGSNCTKLQPDARSKLNRFPIARDSLSSF